MKKGFLKNLASYHKTIFLLMAVFVLATSYASAVGLEQKPKIGVMIPANDYEQAWYVSPDGKELVALGEPKDAFNIMRKFGLGIKNAELQKYFKDGFPKNLAGYVLLDIENKGQAYYISTVDLRAHFLGKPNFALIVFKENGFHLSRDNNIKLDNPLASERKINNQNIDQNLDKEIEVEKKINEESVVDIIVTTMPVSSDSSFSKIIPVSASITNKAKVNIIERGVVWSLDHNPSVIKNGGLVKSKTEDDNFTVNLDNIISGTTYYIKAYAIADEKVFYGNEVEFISASLGGGGGTAPVVTLPRISTTGLSITGVSSLSAGGIIHDDGGGSIIAKGLCWNDSGNPTVESDDCTNVGNNKADFASSITGIDPETIYYVRAYVTNSAGTSYGNQFITCGSTTVTDADGNSYNVIKVGSQCWLKENLNVGNYVVSSAAAPCTDYFDPAVPGTHYWSCQNDDNTVEKYCYGNNPANCATDGALYEWQEAMALPARCVYEDCTSLVNTNHQGLCPNGWHIPTDSEISTLEQRTVAKIASINPQYPCGTSTSYDRWWLRRCADDNGTDDGGTYGAGKSLKKVGYGSGNGAGDDLVGFSALLTGFRSWVDGTFSLRNNFTDFWTTTEQYLGGMPFYAWDRELQAPVTTVVRDRGVKSYGLSVRCVKN